MCRKIETKEQKFERQIRNFVIRKKEEIITLQAEVMYFEKWLKEQEQKNCSHFPQSGDDGAHSYCAKCGKILE